MGTRAMYTFRETPTNTERQIHVYKHWDGYPTGAAQFIEAAKARAWDMPRFEHDDFAAAFVAANKGDSGGDVRMCGANVREPYHMSRDAEFWYVISVLDGALWVACYDINWWNEGREETMELFSGSFDDFVAWTKTDE